MQGDKRFFRRTPTGTSEDDWHVFRFAGICLAVIFLAGMAT